MTINCNLGSIRPRDSSGGEGQAGAVGGDVRAKTARRRPGSITHRNTTRSASRRSSRSRTGRSGRTSPFRRRSCAHAPSRCRTTAACSA